MASIPKSRAMAVIAWRLVRFVRDADNKAYADAGDEAENEFAKFDHGKLLTKGFESI